MNHCVRYVITHFLQAAFVVLPPASPPETGPQKQLLLKKQDLYREGELRESYWLHGRWHNDWLFGLMRHDYQ